MGINWFEILIQVVNFFILLALLNRFLFRPIMAGMEKREKYIEETVQQAEAQLAEAEALIKTYEEKLSGIRKEEKEILLQAKEEALKKKEVLLQQYQEDAQKVRMAFREEVEEERESFLRSFRMFLNEYTLQISRKILSLIAPGLDENAAFSGFLKRVQALPPDIIAEEGKASLSGRIRFVSAAPLSPSQKEELEEVVDRLFPESEIQFLVNPEMLFGYEIAFPTFQIRENLDYYLEDFEKQVEAHYKKSGQD